MKLLSVILCRIAHLYFFVFKHKNGKHFQMFPVPFLGKEKLYFLYFSCVQAFLSINDFVLHTVFFTNDYTT